MWATSRVVEIDNTNLDKIEYKLAYLKFWVLEIGFLSGNFTLIIEDLPVLL